MKLKYKLISIKKAHIKKLILWSCVTLIITLVCSAVAAFFYMADSFSPKIDSIEAFAPQNGSFDKITVKTQEDYIACEGENSTVGFIFYPGARVEAESYIPLAKSCAEKGILTVIARMPLNFSLIDNDAALPIKEEYKHIKKWYIGGHSLGGYAASLHLEKYHKEYEGIILLASYSGTDLTETKLKALCMYGDQDEIMNKSRFEDGIEYLPSSFDVIVIEGGNHSYFGMYEGQDNNKAKRITNEEQIVFTAECIGDFVFPKV